MLLHFHGIPDGRFGCGAGPVCEDRGIRLIAVDRPGVGASSPKPKRTVLDWASDVEELADRLAIESFSVAGQSAGGPYALACARELGDRVESAALISGCGRLDQPGFARQMHTARAWWLAARLPGAMAFLYSASGHLTRRNPALAQKLVAANFPKIDRAVVIRPDVAARLQFAYAEATRAGGGRGLAEDMRTVLSRGASTPPRSASRFTSSTAGATPSRPQRMQSTGSRPCPMPVLCGSRMPATS